MRSKFFILFSLILMLLFLPNLVSADFINPESYIDLYVAFEGESIQDPLFYLNMSTSFCQENINLPDCVWKSGPTVKEKCIDSKCHFSNPFYDYQLPKENKVNLTFYIPSQEQIFISGEFSLKRVDGYKVNLLSDGSIEVDRTLNKTLLKRFFIALILTLALELIIARLFLAKLKENRKKILLYVLFANLISLPIVWFLSPLIFEAEGYLLAELFVMIFEALFIYFFSRKIITLKKSFVMSIVMNLVSLIIGGFLFLIIRRLLSFIY